MNFALALRILNLTLALGSALAYTWVMSKKEGYHSYAGPAQFYRYLGLWSLMVTSSVALVRIIAVQRATSYVTWMFTAALLVNAFAAVLTIRDVLTGVQQINARREDQP